MTFLVTGATGFVGSSLIRALLDKGKDVRVLIRKDSDRTNLKGLNVEILVGDLTEISSLRELAKQPKDYSMWQPITEYGSKNLAFFTRIMCREL